MDTRSGRGCWDKMYGDNINAREKLAAAHLDSSGEEIGGIKIGADRTSNKITGISLEVA